MMKKILLLVLFITNLYLIKSQTYFDFNADDFNGNKVVLSEMLDKGPVVLTFWRYWCPPCTRELVALEKIYEKYEDKGLQVVGVCGDPIKYYDTTHTILKINDIRFVNVYDTDNKIQETYKDFNGYGLYPCCIMIGSNKTISYYNTAFTLGKDEIILENEVKKLFN